MKYLDIEWRFRKKIILPFQMFMKISVNRYELLAGFDARTVCDYNPSFIGKEKRDLSKLIVYQNDIKRHLIILEISLATQS